MASLDLRLFSLAAIVTNVAGILVLPAAGVLIALPICVMLKFNICGHSILEGNVIYAGRTSAIGNRSRL